MRGKITFLSQNKEEATEYGRVQRGLINRITLVKECDACEVQ
jgi:hypothetical protein